jgi:hypothetical protein
MQYAGGNNSHGLTGEHSGGGSTSNGAPLLLQGDTLTPKRKAPPIMCESEIPTSRAKRAAGASLIANGGAGGRGQSAIQS